ncbi:MAG: DUF1622 domain-containing protein [Burkholderiales bacterium]|jgi:uncharacterized membrane protein|nr:DUF1622 domain-containing protein [Burkholderiales bacterium]
MATVREGIEIAAIGIELLAVIIMLLFVAIGTLHWLTQVRNGFESGYGRYRVAVGKSLLIGLELLVAADIIRTVAIEATLTNLGLLALLVLIRTALGWTLSVEIEGRWPWQRGAQAGGGTQPAAD